MLILSRKLSEQIVIYNDIVITVIAIRGGTVRVGVDAPKDVPVHRKEVYDATRLEDLLAKGEYDQASKLLTARPYLIDRLPALTDDQPGGLQELIRTHKENGR
jgi:carbon storage regulator